MALSILTSLLGSASSFWKILKSLFSNKWFWIGVLALVAGYQCYSYGRDVEKDVWQKKQQEQEEIVKQQQIVANQQRSALNNNILVLNSELEKAKQQLEKKEEPVIQEVIKYVQTPAASVRCLDADWVRNYNSSLPSSTK